MLLYTSPWVILFTHAGCRAAGVSTAFSRVCSFVSALKVNNNNSFLWFCIHRPIEQCGSLLYSICWSYFARVYSARKLKNFHFNYSRLSFQRRCRLLLGFLVIHVVISNHSVLILRVINDDGTLYFDITFFGTPHEQFLLSRTQHKYRLNFKDENAKHTFYQIRTIHTRM